MLFSSLLLPPNNIGMPYPVYLHPHLPLVMHATSSSVQENWLRARSNYKRTVRHMTRSSTWVETNIIIIIIIPYHIISYHSHQAAAAVFLLGFCSGIQGKQVQKVFFIMQIWNQRWLLLFSNLTLSHQSETSRWFFSSPSLKNSWRRRPESGEEIILYKVRT